MKKLFIFTIIAMILYHPIFGQNEIIFNFEQDTNCKKYFYIDSSDVNNIWQIGKPNKTTFTSAHSIPNALITDTINPYPPKNASSFILRHTLYNPVIVLDFSYSLNTDTLADYVKIESSVNGGSTWINLTSPVSLFHQWDIMPIFSGNTKGWKTAALQFNTEFFNSHFGDTILFRFSIKSDSIDNQKDGWMIDDLWIFDNNGIGINEFSSSNKVLNISPNPFTTSTQITLNQTYHNILLSVYDIQGKLMLQNRFADCNQIQLNRNGINKGMYFLKLTLDDRWVETGKIVVSE